MSHDRAADAFIKQHLPEQRAVLRQADENAPPAPEPRRRPVGPRRTRGANPLAHALAHLQQPATLDTLARGILRQGEIAAPCELHVSADRCEFDDRPSAFMLTITYLLRETAEVARARQGAAKVKALMAAAETEALQHREEAYLCVGMPDLKAAIRAERDAIRDEAAAAAERLRASLAAPMALELGSSFGCAVWQEAATGVTLRGETVHVLIDVSLAPGSISDSAGWIEGYSDLVRPDLALILTDRNELDEDDAKRLQEANIAYLKLPTPTATRRAAVTVPTL